MKLAVIDGQGGGIGKAIVERISKEFDGTIEIIALGTNATATLGMIKAGANSGATGENAIKVMTQKVDVIIGPIAIIMRDSMMGEITSVMAESISTSEAYKILIPLNRCNVFIPGIKEFKINELIELAVAEIQNIINTNF